MTTDRFDVVLAGGGPVGMALALRLHARAIPTLLLEAQGVPEQVKDPRPLALSYGSRLILQRLGVWDRLSQITPINKIHISNRGYFGRTILTSQEAGVPELGYVVNYHDLHYSMHQLLQSNRSANYQLGAIVSKLTTNPDEATVEYQQHGESKCVAAKLLVLADGGQLAAQIPNIRYHAHEYQQWAVVANVETTIPQSGIAYERFTTDGPVALLPSGTGYALVWTVPVQSVKEILALDDQTFLSALQRHFGDRPGNFIHADKRSGFPLSLKYAVPATAMRTALIGNASQTLHPVAGQGFNLGLRDAWELSSEISALSATPGKIGSQGMLHSYEQKRRLDRNAGKFFTDSLAKIFTADFPVLQAFCGLGLSVLDCLPPAKRFVARRMIFGARG